MSILDRLLMRPERAKGTRVQQTTERFRAAEYRLERDTALEALRLFHNAIQPQRAHDLSSRLGEAREEATRVLEWAAMRESAREISMREGIQ